MSDENESNNVPSELKSKLGELYLYLSKHLGLKEVPQIILTKSQSNAKKKETGLTGYYDPSAKLIRLYTTDRSDGDILRSFAHEVIHHWQNENGTLNNQSAGDHYAQDNPELRKREYEAFLYGSILYRDWQDEKRHGPPKTKNTLPKIVAENLIIQHSSRLKDGIKMLIQQFVNDGTIGSYYKPLTSGDMNPNDFIEEFTTILVAALNKQVEMINGKSDRNNPGHMIN